MRMRKGIMSKFKRTKLACYMAYFTMSSIFALPPILFLPLREMYGISYTLLGTLVLVNFFTQMSIDLIFTFFSKHFPIAKVIRIMPLITSAGLGIYAVFPLLFPDLAYVGLVLGTVIFSVSAGLSEVLLSPVIAAIPSENPQRDISFLHSLYAFGVLTVVLVSTLFLKVFGNQNWWIITLILAAMPILSAVLFMTSPIPNMETQPPAAISGNRKHLRGMVLCVGCIFFGSCAENTMSNWVSGFVETALGVDKALGDVLGMAMFAILLGIARISYAKFGKKIMPILMGGMIGAAACYLLVGLSSNPAVVLVACMLTGLFTSMLWPGTLILMEEKIPNVGVTAYALMAASGDMGASVAPQLMGVVTDTVAASPLAASLSQTLNLSTEQIGMKAGMLVSAVFPILGVILLLIAMRYFKKKEQA